MGRKNAKDPVTRYTISFRPSVMEELNYIRMQRDISWSNYMKEFLDWQKDLQKDLTL